MSGTTVYNITKAFNLNPRINILSITTQRYLELDQLQYPSMVLSSSLVNGFKSNPLMSSFISRSLNLFTLGFKFLLRSPISVSSWSKSEEKITFRINKHTYKY